jgi:hypothetical protein
MATFVLIHGAGDVGWYWHLVEAELLGGGSAGSDRAHDPRARGGARGLLDGHRFVEEVRESYDDEIALFYQDVPPELASEALKRGRTQSEARMHEPLPLEAWPDMPTRSCSVGTIACSRLPSFAASPLSASA